MNASEPNSEDVRVGARDTVLISAGALVWVALGLWLVSGSPLLGCVGDRSGRRSRALEVYLCSPRLLGGDPLDWLLFAWLWLPFAAMAAYIAYRMLISPGTKSE